MQVLTPPATRQLAIRASAEDIRPASEWLATIGNEHGIPGDQIFRLDLCLNEALGNIVFHGGPSAHEAPVFLTLTVSTDDGEHRAALSVSDAGIPFNPLQAEAKHQAPSLAEATPGGLGLTMIAGYCDRLDYDFRNGCNHLTFNICWDASA